MIKVGVRPKLLYGGACGAGNGMKSRHIFRGFSPVNRELRIDILRGIAMLTILLNHFWMTYRAVGFTGPAIPTPTQLGYSSAASIFVALSGYMVGMVYMRRERPIRAVLRRAAQLYLINLAIFAIVSPVALFADPGKDRFWYMHVLIEEPVSGVVRFLTLRDAPAFLDVLQLYVALLLMTPVAMLLARRSRWLLAGCSAGFWALIQLWPFMMPASLPVPAIGRTLNALAWQMAFFLPMIAGLSRWHEPIFAFFRRRPAALLPIAVLLVGAAWTHEIDPLFAEPRVHLALTSRPVHGPVWTAHAALLLSGYLGLLSWLTPHLHAVPFRLLASLGRNSLNVYAASIPLIFSAALAIGAFRIDRAGYLLGTALIVAASFGVAAWSDWRRQRERAFPLDLAAQPA